jgi:hypothetical protein
MVVCDETDQHIFGNIKCSSAISLKNPEAKERRENLLSHVFIEIYKSI